MPEMIARALIRPNDYNVNAFDPENYPKLVDSIRQRGILEPLKLMPDPDQEGHFLLVDGYHRWRAAGDLDIDPLPCEVWHISLEEAKLRSLQLNYLRGHPVPRRLASLVHDLEATQGLDALARQLPWSTAQLKDSLELLRMPADMADRLSAAAAAEAAEAAVPITVVCVGPERIVFEDAMRTAKEQLSGNPRRGTCLAEICRVYLDSLGQSAE